MEAEGKVPPTPAKNRFRHWLRVLRPLSWWFILVLLLFTYRTHERLSAETRLVFSVALEGQTFSAFETSATLDGQRVSSGNQLSIGWHTLAVSHPKAEPYSTNLFVWYGERNLGDVLLKRSKGVLSVTVNPPTGLLTIRGPESAVMLTNSSGVTSSVPTDRYVIQAKYRYSEQKEQVTVLANSFVPVRIAPRLGAIQLECNQTNSFFRLMTSNDRLMQGGYFPATLTELPEGNYKLIADHNRNQREDKIEIKAGTTNSIRIEFTYGVAVLESIPAGAAIKSNDGREWGSTPLTLPELKPGTWVFMLELAGYESSRIAIDVVANQTNVFRTNLISRAYTHSMAEARQYFAAADYNRALEAVSEALRAKPDDSEALALQREATGLAHLSQAETLGKRGNYAAAIKEVNLALAVLPENVSAKELLADCTKREQERIDAEKKREAELAEQERKRQAAELTAKQRQQRLNRLEGVFEALSQGYADTASFNSHALTASNQVDAVALAINSAIQRGESSFQVMHYDRPQSNMFLIQARQQIGIGYRECLIVGGQVGENETRILFKVFEYENPPDLNVLGGLLRISATVKSTSQDPKVVQASAERFRTRTEEGVKIVTARIHESTPK